MIDQIKLSKTISRALRHDPDSFGLVLTVGGWVKLADLLTGLQKQAIWEKLTEADIVELVTRPGKQRFELKDDRIRALYGHSVTIDLQRERQTPPRLLYHGTSPEAVNLIRRQGLKAMGRQHVHLSADLETAMMVGKRKTSRPVILTIYAAQAAKQEIPFYHGNHTTWLADFVPPQFISEEDPSLP